MSRDLTDHVREKDEAEGPLHKPVTDEEAKEMLIYHETPLPVYLGLGTKEWIWPGREDTKRLLADRTVAMEMIEGLIHGCTCCWWDDCDCGCWDDCITHNGKARALVAAVKGE